MGKDADELRREIAETRERMGDTADAIAYKADVPHRMQDAVGDKVDQMKSAITGTVGHARRAVAGAGQRAGGMLPDAGDVQSGAMNAVNAVRENPLGLFFGMAALGFLIGSLLPATDFERENVGPMVGQLKDRAIDEVQDRIETAKDAAVDAVTSSFQSSSPSPQA